MRTVLQRSKGFTLVELIIVLTVIAIILAVVLPSFRGMRQEANMSRAQQELNTLKTAVTSYFRNNNAYPANVHAALTGASPRIITSILEDPFKTDASTTPNTYGYVTGTDASFGEYFIVYSKGPDATAATVWNAATGQVDVGGDDIAASNAPLNKVP